MVERAEDGDVKMLAGRSAYLLIVPSMLLLAWVLSVW